MKRLKFKNSFKKFNWNIILKWALGTAFFMNILGNLSPPILAKYKKNVSFFSYKRVIKIPLLYEIQPFDNTEKVYESISGHTDRNPV